MRVAVSADHAGVLMRRRVVEHLTAAGHDVLDLGIDDPDEPDDYPDRAAECGRAVAEGRAELGVLICGSGAGAAIAANKVRGVRAALCHDSFSARQSREDDDANVICLGERVIGQGLALELIDRFLSSSFSGIERHQRRLDKVLALEAALSGTPEGDRT
jgi:ribose 5-phosphate isomerase B